MHGSAGMCTGFTSAYGDTGVADEDGFDDGYDGPTVVEHSRGVQVRQSAMPFPEVAPTEIGTEVGTEVGTGVEH